MPGKDLQFKIETSLSPLFYSVLDARIESYQWLKDGWGKEPDDSEVPRNVELQVDQYITQRLAGEPWPYIIGFSWFMGQKFICHQDAFIPRQYTSKLIHTALELFDPEKPLRVVDVGTGTGALAITLAQKTKWKLTATDSSAQAMKIAEKNCNFHNRNDIELMVGNVITSMVRIPDLVVGHMPCIDETMKSKLKEGSLKDSSDPFAYKEPDVALFCGEDGNFWIKALLKQSYEWRVPAVIQHINNKPQEMLEYAQSLGWHTGWITNEGHNPVLITLRNP